jgi:hypothetical protein
MVLCCGLWDRFWFGGNQWSAWTGYLSFFRHVAKLNLPEYEAFQHYEAAVLHGGPAMLHSKFWIACDYPECVHRDAENRPHCENGPFTAWDDGIALYAWHGTTVPAKWIEDKASLDPKTALTWPNVEQRRAAAEIIGWKRVIDSLRPTIVDVDGDPEIGVLMRVDLPDAPGSQFLKVRCGTKREFCLPVPAEMRTARQANAWTFQLEPNELQLEVRT